LSARRSIPATRPMVEFLPLHSLRNPALSHLMMDAQSSEMRNAKPLKTNQDDI
jgi:hypothetical protein